MTVQSKSGGKGVRKGCEAHPRASFRGRLGRVGLFTARSIGLVIAARNWGSESCNRLAGPAVGAGDRRSRAHAPVFAASELREARTFHTSLVWRTFLPAPQSCRSRNPMALHPLASRLFALSRFPASQHCFLPVKGLCFGRGRQPGRLSPRTLLFP